MKKSAHNRGYKIQGGQWIWRVRFFVVSLLRGTIIHVVGPTFYSLGVSANTFLQMKYIFIILFFSSCAIVNKYNSTEQLYYQSLTAQEIQLLKEKGDIYKTVELIDSETNNREKHELRVTFNQEKNKFNFVRIGNWVERGYNSSNSPLNSPEQFLDSLSVDDQGNVIYRATYVKKNSQNNWIIDQKWTSEIKNDKFFQYYKIFNDGIISWEGTSIITDYKSIKPFTEKNTIKYGKGVSYDESGNVKKIEVFDEKGIQCKKKSTGANRGYKIQDGQWIWRVRFFVVSLLRGTIIHIVGPYILQPQRYAPLLWITSTFNSKNSTYYQIQNG